MNPKLKAILLTTLFSLVTVLSFTATTYAACTPVPNGSYPKTLVANTNYCLTANAALTTTADAFIISGDNITFDLGGFDIIKTSNPGTGTAINYSGVHKNITIKNGRIIGFKYGIWMEDIGCVFFSNVVVDGVSIINYGNFGMYIVGNGVIVRNCQITNGPDGMTIAGSGNTVINNDVVGTTINVRGQCPSTNGSNNVVENNRIAGLVTPIYRGIDIQGNVLVVNNRIRNATVGVYCYSDSAENCSGAYRDNLTTNCTIPYSVPGFIDAGNNQ